MIELWKMSRFTLVAMFFKKNGWANIYRLPLGEITSCFLRRKGLNDYIN